MNCVEMVQLGMLGNLSDDDDPRLWTVAIAIIFADAAALARSNRSRRPIYAEIGRCSHWMSPHNKGSWFKEVEKFAWPSGYGRYHGSVVLGLPEFDWSVAWQWDAARRDWKMVPQFPSEPILLFRVALPGRSARHVRAVAHTLWTPGSPTMPKKDLLQGYAFKKKDEDWKCVAVAGPEAAYNDVDLGAMIQV